MGSGVVLPSIFMRAIGSGGGGGDVNEIEAHLSGGERRHDRRILAFGWRANFDGEQRSRRRGGVCQPMLVDDEKLDLQQITLNEHANAILF